MRVHYTFPSNDGELIVTVESVSEPYGKSHKVSFTIAGKAQESLTDVLDRVGEIFISNECYITK